MEMNVLITQGTCPFAQRVAKLVPAARIVFAASDDISEVLLHTGKYVKIPRPSDPTFVHEVLRRCMDNAIELVIPLGMAELYPMAVARPLFAEYDIALCVPEMAALAELMIVENPPREMPLSILQEGAAIAGNTPGMQQGALSGVFTPSDTDHDMALCCVTD